MSEEVWKDVIGYEGLYQVSNLGRVKSLVRNRILPPHNTSNGYLQVHLYYMEKPKYAYIHRLVAEAFCDNTNARNEVNHIDGNRINNTASNLEWCTRTENHHTEIYLRRQREAKRRKMKPVVQLDLDGNIVGRFDCIHEACRRTGIFRNAIKKCCERPNSVTHGYLWQYA